MKNLKKAMFLKCWIICQSIGLKFHRNIDYEIFLILIRALQVQFFSDKKRKVTHSNLNGSTSYFFELKGLRLILFVVYWPLNAGILTGISTPVTFMVMIDSATSIRRHSSKSPKAAILPSKKPPSSPSLPVASSTRKFIECTGYQEY